VRVCDVSACRGMTHRSAAPSGRSDETYIEGQTPDMVERVAGIVCVSNSRRGNDRSGGKDEVEKKLNWIRKAKTNI
jgi:hypothetical protein